MRVIIMGHAHHPSGSHPDARAARAQRSGDPVASDCHRAPDPGACAVVFDAPEHQSVLQSAEAAGLHLPSSCRNGTCRTCVQRLASGRVSYRIEWPGLLAEEKAAGWFLPCVAFPDTDLVVMAGPSTA